MAMKLVPLPDAPVTRCADCGGSLGGKVQGDLPGVPARCTTCQTKARTRTILCGLPTPDEREWSVLTDWEQEFVTSVRRQAERPGWVPTEKQFQVLERVWKRV